MKVWIDGELCTGVALCEGSAPDVFVMADDGVAHVRHPDGSMAPDKTAVDFADHLLEDVIEAAEGCPEDCIYIEA